MSLDGSWHGLEVKLLSLNFKTKITIPCILKKKKNNNISCPSPVIKNTLRENKIVTIGKSDSSFLLLTAHIGSRPF